MFPLMVLALLCGVAWIIWGEFTRPRPTQKQDQEIMHVLNLYRNAGYTTYHVSVQTPELFFIFADKGLDVNNGTRNSERIYIDVYKKEAYNYLKTEKVVLPIRF